MKKTICFVLSFLIIFSFNVNATGISHYASSAILYCSNDGNIYYSFNESRISKIASTTKIMTALLALEYANKNNKRIEFKESMIAEGSSMYLKVGEIVTLYDLAVGLLLASGNDAANAVAYGISGSIEEFAKLMNKRGKEIGMKNTNFVNPSGLNDDNHYSTAYDMALLMNEAMKNKDFAKISSTKTQTVNFVYPPDKSTTYSNHNRLLSMYEYCIGGKTGYTIASGRCLVTVAKRNELTFICVTLNDRNDFKDHISLFEYGFSNYKLKILDDTNVYFDIKTLDGAKTKTLVSSDDISSFVLKNEDFSKIKRKVIIKNLVKAPVLKNTQIGKIVYTLNNEILITHKLIAVENNLIRKKTYLEILKEIIKLWLQI